MGHQRFIVVMLLVACGGTSPTDPGGESHRVGGRVHGLWDGSEGVVLQLEAAGATTALTVMANGEFQFPGPIAPGMPYAVTVMTSPRLHTCVVEGGGAGTMAGADIADASVACSGPVGAVEISGHWGWTFDPTQEVQRFAGSVVAQDVVLTIRGGRAETAHVAGTQVRFGEAATPIPLALGTTMVPVVFTASGGLSKTYQLVFDRGGAVLDQVAYGKPSNTATRSSFGTSVALSGDTLVVGAIAEASGATGVDGDQADRSAPGSGAVYVFVRKGSTWAQQAYLKASNGQADDLFGFSLALSGDTLAVGAVGEDSGAAGINGNQADNTSLDAGAVYVFVRTAGAWTQEAYVKASNPHAADNFGFAVALSGDTLAVGAFGESSKATGIDGDQTDRSASTAGAVYVFARTGQTWAQQAYVKASNTGAFDEFGNSLALSGTTLIVGAPGESSGARGSNGDQTDDAVTAAGAAYVFVRAGTGWTQQAYLKASNPGRADRFGYAVALSGDTAAVGAISESSSATGVDPAGGQADNSAPNAGAAYVFVRQGTTWTQQAYLKASNTKTVAEFGASLALVRDTLAVGAHAEASPATGVDGAQTGATTISAGAAYVFVRAGATWQQRAYVKASNTDAYDSFGDAIALSSDALVIGAPGEASGATGIDPPGGQRDNTASRAGAFYLFR